MRYRIRLARRAVGWGCCCLVALACGGEEPTTPGSVPGGPVVVSVGPAPQSLVAGRQTTISVTFDRPVTPAPRVVKAFGRWSGPMAGDVNLSTDRQTLTFTPAGTFAAGEWVTITVTGGVVDDNGESLVGSYSWNFWVASINR